MESLILDKAHRKIYQQQKNNYFQLKMHIWESNLLGKMKKL